MLRIEVFDAIRREWRDFSVVPTSLQFVPKCANSLHQFHLGAKQCACGEIRR